MRLFAVQIEPLPLQAKVVGTLIAIGMLALCAGFWKRQKRKHGDDSPQLSPRLLRPFLYATFALSAVVLLFGVWIDPGEMPRAFVAIWIVIFFLASTLVAVASLDAFVVGRRGARQQSQLADEQARVLQRDIESIRRRDTANPKSDFKPPAAK